MLKRFLIFCVLAAIAVVVGAVVYAQLTPAPAPVVKQVLRRKAPAQAKPWNGVLSRVYDATFVRANDQIKLQTVDYSGLNTAATDVTFNIVVTPGAFTKPAWLKATA